MLQYLLLVIACQVLFLFLYDVFLKRQTFFNINRVYLLLTPLLSLVLPFVKISSLERVVPAGLVLPKFSTNNAVIQLSEVVVSEEMRTSFWSQFSIWEYMFAIGFMISLAWFFFKLIQLQQLKKRGKIQWKKHFYEVEVPQSNIAFSFFNTMFLGEEVKQKPHAHIVAHELVHMQQKHSWDLLYFEVFRIVFWFNPLVYLYQHRISELHEFIADSNTSKKHKKEQYQQLLQEVFQTENISFINQFFNQSLIKKRIVMLQKSKSKKSELVKYALVIPMLAGIMVYTSACNQEETSEVVTTESSSDKSLVTVEGTTVTLHVANLDDLTSSEEWMKTALILQVSAGTYEKLQIEDASGVVADVTETRTVSSYTNDTSIVADVPFTVVEKRPAFKGFENQPAEVFKEQLDQHVRTTFRYPKEAQDQKIQGRVYINFRINTDGSVTILGVRGPSPILEAEAKRIINALPTFIPGEQRGKVVPVTFAYPIVFRLN